MQIIFRLSFFWSGCRCMQSARYWSVVSFRKKIVCSKNSWAERLIGEKSPSQIWCWSPENFRWILPCNKGYRKSQRRFTGLLLYWKLSIHSFKKASSVKCEPHYELLFTQSFYSESLSVTIIIVIIFKKLPGPLRPSRPWPHQRGDLHPDEVQEERDPARPGQGLHTHCHTGEKKVPMKQETCFKKHLKKKICLNSIFFFKFQRKNILRSWKILFLYKKGKDMFL